MVESTFDVKKFEFCFVPAMTDKVNQIKHKKVKLSKPPIYKERKRLAHGDKQFCYAIKDIQKEEARQDRYDRITYNGKL